MKPVTIHRETGFTLIELMISMVLGLIVIGAVFALSLAMLRANKETIASTRLTQELRSVSTVIATGLQRAGSADNPLLIKKLKDANISVVDTDTVNCIKFKQADASGAAVLHSFSLGNDGAVYAGTSGCGATDGKKLTSSNVKITSLSFVKDGVRMFTVTLKGEFDLGKEGKIEREFSRTVFSPALIKPKS